MELYTIHDIVAQGTYSVVYRATYHKTGAVVAVKQYDATDGKQPARHAAHELRALRKLEESVDGEPEREGKETFRNVCRHPMDMGPFTCARLVQLAHGMVCFMLRMVEIDSQPQMINKINQTLLRVH